MRTNYKQEQETQRFFTKVFGWMFLGLLISGFTAYAVSVSPVLLSFIFNIPIIFIGLVIFQFILVMALAGLINKVSAQTAAVLFLFYSFVTGLTLSVIFLVYTAESINMVFFITAGMFGVMSFIGYTTKIDLTRIGPIFFMALIGIIIAVFLNFIFRSSMLEFIINILGILIFTGLTAYDIQRIKRRRELSMHSSHEEHQKQAVRGALSLYLDFINLFLSLLRLTGKRKR